MFRAIKDENLTRNRLRCNQIWILRHVARTVDLAIVVNLLNDLDTRLRRDGMSAQFAKLIIVVVAIQWLS